MGLLDIFRRNKKEEVQEEPRPMPPQNEMRMYETEQGRKVYELYDNEPKARQFYDSTRVIMDTEPQIINGEMLYDCFVSWYGENDCIMFGKNGELGGRQFEYSHVIAGINPGLMETDPEYFMYTLKQLFDKKRVERYLETGLMTDEEIEAATRAGERGVWPCGRYIGKVERDSEGRLGKTFNARIGKMLHNTSEMQEKREAKKREEEQARIAEMAEKGEKIAQLRAELEALQEEDEKSR